MNALRALMSHLAKTESRAAETAETDDFEAKTVQFLKSVDQGKSTENNNKNVSSTLGPPLVNSNPRRGNFGSNLY